jgi:7-carboxy-7-deazaguanine synthase
VFVRFAGCNFKCAGWPCDTQHAIDPKLFKKTQVFYDPIALAEHVLTFGVNNICLTGGEVFLQNKTDLQLFINAMRVTNEQLSVECFTNGALRWGDNLALMIGTFILDWKLPGSGEEYEGTTVFEENFNQLGAADAVKFTIKDETDYTEAKRRYEKFIRGKLDEPMVYAGVVWDDHTYRTTWSTEELCAHMQSDGLPWRLNVQVHKFVWNPNRIGV